MERIDNESNEREPYINLAAQRIHLQVNLKLDNGVEGVLKALITSRNDSTDYRDLDLERKTKSGDTLLHRIVHATVDHPEDMELYMQLVDIITVNSVTWWCKKINVTATGDSKFKHDAVNYLLTNVKDAKDRHVWKVAFEKVAVDMIRKLLFLEDVTCSRKRNGIYFDMSQFALNTSFTLSNCCSSICGLYCNFHRMEPGLAKLMKHARDKKKVADILSIKAVKNLVDMYSSFTTKLYILTVFLHILYMAVFSYAGCDLMDSRNSSTSLSTKGLLYGIGLMEPIILTIYLICEIPKCITVKCGLVHKENKAGYIQRFIIRFSIVLVYTVLVCHVISRVDKEIRTIDRNVLSVCLLYGWLLTFALADGIQPLHFFFRLVMRVMATDVLKVLLVYVIFLTGFSLAMHAQFIATPNITSTYYTPIQTMYLMFNVMMGLEEAIDENTEQFLAQANASILLSKLLYIGYTVCCSIVLINLLIAMMNTSYSKIRDEHSAEWVCDAALFGIRTSEYFPALSRRFGVKYVYYGSIFDNKAIDEKGLYLVLDKEDLEENETFPDTSSSTDVDLQQVVKDVKRSEIRLRNQITEISSTQRKMMECIENLQAQMSQLHSGNTKTVVVSDARY